MALNPATITQIKTLLSGAQDKIEQLRTIEPFFIDLSLRENPVGARVGQTLADKLAILPKIRALVSTRSCSAPSITPCQMSWRSMTTL